MNNNVLVTGAFGFVGQWLVQELLTKENKVIAMCHDNITLVHNWKFKDVELWRGDIRDYDFLEKIEIVFRHLQL